MRFAIALLVILRSPASSAPSSRRTIRIPNYVNQFGPFWADIFRALSLYTVYSSWWFMLILGLPDGLGVAVRDPQRAEDARRHEELEGQGPRRQPARVSSQGRVRGARHARADRGDARKTVGQARLQVRHARIGGRDADRRQARCADQVRLHLGAPCDRRHLSWRPARQQSADQAADVAVRQDADPHRTRDQRHSAGHRLSHRTRRSAAMRGCRKGSMSRRRS